MSVIDIISEKKLKEWAGWKAFRDGVSLYERGVVEKIKIDSPFVTGQLNLGPRGMRSRFEVLKNGLVENHCPCRDNQERGLICSHLVAMGLAVIDQQKKEINSNQKQNRVDRIMRGAKGIRIRRARKSTPGAVHAKIYLKLNNSWIKEIEKFFINIAIYIKESGKKYPISEIKPEKAIYLGRNDNKLLQMFEEYGGGGAKYNQKYSISQFVEILSLCSDDTLLLDKNNNLPKVSKKLISTILEIDLDHNSGELVLNLLNQNNLKDNIFILGDKKGCVYSENCFYPLESILPDSLHSVYNNILNIPRNRVPSFLMSELPHLEKIMDVRKIITSDLFYMKPAKPKFRLHIKGSAASLSAKLFVIYDEGYEFIAGRADRRGNFAIPDSRDLLKYRIRNMYEEKSAVRKLTKIGFEGRAGDTLRNIEGVNEVLNFLGSGVPKIQRMGWKVELEGRVRPFIDKTETISPTITIKESNDGSYFDLSYEYESNTESISENEIKRALSSGNSFIQRKGKTILLDGDAIMQALEIFEDCAIKENAKNLRKVDSIYSSYVYTTLNELDGVEVSASKKWMERVKALNNHDKVKQVNASSKLNGSLRSYQQEGLNWLRFLECRGFCGILADEMGLGKTVQTLAWLQLNRSDKEHQDLPSLIICPTSLVENWLEEANRFTPNLKTLVLQGSDRHHLWEKIVESDLVITSYALMRRDIEHHLKNIYAIAILDEAQQIKNRTTQNALAAKKIVAHHRLVLSGTPIENSVTDLWSIMDFLMPNYLGNHKSFHEKYELPIINGGNLGEVAQSKLKRKLKPFLLRRLKKEVAKDLPPKIERVAPCKLTEDQLIVYRQILEDSKNHITKIVEKRGFNKSRMEILKTLLRLRQTCNHIDLLNLKDVKSKHPSGKMDLFFSLLNEAISGSHRVLVFSQFTTMLSILRTEMEKQHYKYCYLDGGTKNRQDVVRLFNRDHSIPVFLMSLKAGGTGLNLTGADMVIHFDPWWNPAVENQATDRAHRIGQKRTVYSVKLITKGTIEEKVLALQESKKNMIDATLTSDEQIMQKLTWEDVQELLKI